MKKTILATSILAVALGVHAQGTILFQDSKSASTLEIKIYAPQTDVPSVETTGNSTSDYPAGSTVYSGGLIGGTSSGVGPYFYTDGSDYTAELYAAPGDNSTATLTPVTQYTSTFYTAPSTAAGYFKAVTPVNDPGIPNTPSATQGSATAQLAVWYNGGGTYSTYALAVAAGVPAGESPAFNIDGLGGYNDNGTITPDTSPLMTNMKSFSLAIIPVPEPSTIALGVIGATSFLFRRRNK